MAMLDQTEYPAKMARRHWQSAHFQSSDTRWPRVAVGQMDTLARAAGAGEQARATESVSERAAARVAWVAALDEAGPVVLAAVHPLLC